MIRKIEQPEWPGGGIDDQDDYCEDGDDDDDDDEDNDNGDNDGDDSPPKLLAEARGLLYKQCNCIFRHLRISSMIEVMTDDNGSER